MPLHFRAIGRVRLPCADRRDSSAPPSPAATTSGTPGRCCTKTRARAWCESPLATWRWHRRIRRAGNAPCRARTASLRLRRRLVGRRCRAFRCLRPRRAQQQSPIRRPSLFASRQILRRARHLCKDLVLGCARHGGNGRALYRRRVGVHLSRLSRAAAADDESGTADGRRLRFYADAHQAGDGASAVASRRRVRRRRRAQLSPRPVRRVQSQSRRAAR